MKIHEYQAKELFRKYNIPVPLGGVAYSADEAIQLAKELGRFPVVIKAQIHAGGRGKGCPVHFPLPTPGYGSTGGVIHPYSPTGWREAPPSGNPYHLQE